MALKFWLAITAFFAVLVSQASAQAMSPDGGSMAFFGAAKFVVLSEKAGAETFHVNKTVAPQKKMVRKAVQYSPLAWYLPEKWVPIVASLIGAALMSLLHAFSSMSQAFMESLISDRKKQKIKIKPVALKVAGIKVREAFSVTAAASVLGVAITWTYAGPSSDFMWLLILNAVICLIAGLSHEMVHKIAGKLLKIRSEYTFWPFGSLMTLLTAFLGNAFGLQGMLVDEVEAGVEKWKVGVMKLSGLMFSTLMLLVSAAANFFYPSVVFQMISSISGILSMGEVLPFRPMDGYDIRKWSIPLWVATFAFILATFVVVNFII
jgi:hypothetical protein